MPGLQNWQRLCLLWFLGRKIEDAIRQVANPHIYAQDPSGGFGVVCMSAGGGDFMVKTVCEDGFCAGG